MTILKYLWQHLTTRLSNEKGIWPVIAGAAAAGLGSYFGSQKKLKFDPYGTLNPEQIALTKQMGPELQGRAFTSAPMYGGQYTAPLTGGEQDLISRDARLGALAGQGFETILKGEFPEDYYQKSIYQPMMKQFQEDVQPQIEEQYAGAGGYWGGARAGAVAKGYRDLQDTLASERARLGYQARYAPIQAYPAYAGAALQSAQLQGLERQIKQYGLDRQYDEFVRTRPENLPYLQAALQFLGISTGTVQEESKYKLWPQLLSAGGSALMLGGMLGGGGGSTAASSSAGIGGQTPGPTSFGGSKLYI